MRKEKIIQILRKTAINYHKNLDNKNFIVIYKEEEKIKYIQIKFSKGNFLHLTGVQLNKKMSAILFYKKCLNGKISKEEVNLKQDGTTELKLQILEMITNICMTAKMIGQYNNLRKNLYTEFILGTNYISLGLIQTHSNFFIPNTALYENLKDVVFKSYRIIAIFSKKINEELYNEICLYKNVKIDNAEILQKLNDNIKEIIHE